MKIRGIIEETGGYSTDVYADVIGETKEECDMFIGRYFDQYFYGAYLTEVVKPPEYRDEQWVARVKRLSSCD